MAEDTDLKAFIHDKYEQLFSDWTAEFPFPSYLEGLYSDDWDLLMFVGKKNNKKMLFMLSLIPTGIQSLVVLTVMGSKAFRPICAGLP
jgi:hypothetical protein